jgi:hypothetical protein
MIVSAIVQCVLLVAGPALTRPPAARPGPGAAVRAVPVEEIRVKPGPGEAGFLAKPVFLAAGSGHVFVADALDCAVKVFSEDGRLEACLGRKGKGPGEFSFPSGVSVRDGRLYVADKFNRRIQILDGAGRPLGSFRVPFFPDRVFALDTDRILVTHNPSGRLGAEKMLHVCDRSGTIVWEGLDSFVSGDPVYDAFRNMILVNPGRDGDFFVVFRSQERSILRFGSGGTLLETVPVDKRYAFRPMTLPVSGPEKVLLGFCWAAAFDAGRLYLLAPEYTDGGDLGPGRRLFVLDGGGRLEETIDLPRLVSAIAVAGSRLFVLDADGELGIFRVLR